MNNAIKQFAIRKAAPLQISDSKTFELLYRDYRQPLLDFAGHYLRDKQVCEEIVQELFVHLYYHEMPLVINSSVFSYLRVALRNKIFNYLRNDAVYRRHLHIAGNNLKMISNDVEEFVDWKDIQNTISGSLKEMPVKYRQVYELKIQNRFTVKRISKLLARPVGTVEKQLRRATGIVRDVLLKDYNL